MGLGWVWVWAKIGGRGRAWASVREYGRVWAGVGDLASVSWHGRAWASIGWSGCGRPGGSARLGGSGRSARFWAGLGGSGWVWAGLGRFGRVWAGLGWCGWVCAGLGGCRVGGSWWAGLCKAGLGLLGDQGHLGGLGLVMGWCGSWAGVGGVGAEQELGFSQVKLRSAPRRPSKSLT